MACQAEIDPYEESQEMTLIAEADTCEEEVSFSTEVDELKR